jgi:hypothetical protein
VSLLGISNYFYFSFKGAINKYSYTNRKNARIYRVAEGSIVNNVMQEPRIMTSGPVMIEDLQRQGRIKTVPVDQKTLLDEI